MNRITTNVDQKLLRTTKFPPEFSQKVDTTKINIPVIKNWAAGEVSKILGYEDDVVINLLFDLLEGSKNIQLTGFLEKDAALFCKELWDLCLSAQKSDTGIPQQLVEAKKLELIQEKVEQERAIEAARQRREDERIRERDLENVRNRDRDRRDRGGRGRGRGGGGGRDLERRPQRDYSRSQSPPSRQPYGSSDFRRNRPSARETDSYVPAGEASSRRGVRRQRSPSISRRDPGSVSPRRTSPTRARRNARRNTSSERSRSRSVEDRYAKRPHDGQRAERRHRDSSPYSRRRSPPPKRRRDSSSSPKPRRYRSRTPSRSRPSRKHRDDKSISPPRRRRSPSFSEDNQNKRANSVKDRHSGNIRSSKRSRSRQRSRSRSRETRRRSTSLTKSHDNRRHLPDVSEERTMKKFDKQAESTAGAAEEVGADS
ncbi:hypothetical protein E4T47_03406 [Aureobasidium subglaciale]|nr:hypothetical protein E4T43_04997 [Aureobasidium subglaciale]KAI5273253.1 hypothetical protein E4T47_03406 [Aureobasidium subglaciale]